MTVIKSIDITLKPTVPEETEGEGNSGRNPGLRTPALINIWWYFPCGSHGATCLRSAYLVLTTALCQIPSPAPFRRGGKCGMSNYVVCWHTCQEQTWSQEVWLRLFLFPHLLLVMSQDISTMSEWKVQHWTFKPLPRGKDESRWNCTGSPRIIDTLLFLLFHLSISNSNKPFSQFHWAQLLDQVWAWGGDRQLEKTDHNRTPTEPAVPSDSDHHCN